MTTIVNKSELETILSSDKEKLFLLDFNAPWCGPCRMMKNVFRELSAKDLSNVEILDIDVDEALELAEEYRVRTIPLILFVKDNMILDRINGSVSKNDLLNKIKKNNGK